VTSEAPLEKFSYLNRSNLEYVESQYQSFLKNPESIEADWRLFFEGMEFALKLNPNPATASSAKGLAGGISSKELDVYNLIRAYRDYGHFEAALNPLSTAHKSFPELSFNNFNLSDADLEQSFQIGAIVGKPGAKLKDIIEHLRNCYCRTISVQVAEAMPTIRDWFIREFETAVPMTLNADQKKKIFESVVKTESFEKFIHTRYVGKKRFSIEGGDSMIPMLESLVLNGTPLGVEEIVIGMAHRGRLNVLVNFMGKAADVIFAEFEGIRDDNNSFFDGDVKYHLGYSSDKQTANGPCHISLAYNPSHLEAVDPVVCGMVRAKQRRRSDTQERKKVIPVLLHGDGAFPGQGVVAETFTMSQLKGYTLGGTVHIVVDNQVAFTTSPENDRSSPYASDIAKMLQTPVLHVNGDDVEACVRAMDMAIRFRQEFKRDIVINMICYRRYGHNEGDEPAYTQPQMYDKIKAHPTLFQIYGKKLMSEGLIDQAYMDNAFQTRIDQLQKILDDVRKNPPQMKPLVFDGFWKGFRRATHEDFQKPTKTATKLETLKEAAKILTTIPSGFNLHPKLNKLVENRAHMLDGDGNVDWGMGELLSYGTLLLEGTPVRLSGQDCVRGTFTHRHAAFYDTKTGERFSPLGLIKPEEVEFCVYDSPLSEYAVLGFEYGNSSSDPTFLTIWEAQFGDFVNGAQIILDQFLASGEQKWQRMSGLVLLLPHGYEGQGPEHSSARLERFLQQCAQDNIQVVNLTTPAQLFHAMRRQVKREFRKPLIIMSPKSLLRHPLVVSKVDDFVKGTFEEVIPDYFVTAKKAEKKVETAILVSGKLYYDLLAEREKQDKDTADKTALIRVEQFYPFADHKMLPILKSFPSLKRIVWAQEEPKNMGAWTFMSPRITEMLEDAGMDVPLIYIGRTERASPATGSEKVHLKEQAEIVQTCLTQSTLDSKVSVMKPRARTK
jgi:2-oxoglutarate dehydrogenase E1 component